MMKFLADPGGKRSWKEYEYTDITVSIAYISVVSGLKYIAVLIRYVLDELFAYCFLWTE